MLLVPAVAYRHALFETDTETVAALEQAGNGAIDLAAACELVAHGHGLSARESELLPYLARGHRPPFIAEQLCISENTVRTHMRNMYRKLGVSSGEELIQLVECIRASGENPTASEIPYRRGPGPVPR